MTDASFESCPIPALPPPVAVRLTVMPAHDCSYLPGRQAVHRGFMTDRLPGELYHRFMDAGFRRSGRVFYQPICGGCRECVPIRVPTDQFRPSKSQRRVMRRNADLSVTVGPAIATDEKFDLYRRYLQQRHDRADGDDGRESFESFLYDSPVDTIEFQYRNPSGKLVGVGICDVCPMSLSTVYFYFDPAEQSRSLGTFSALTEIRWASDRKIANYYLGFFIAGCRKMSYKANFFPQNVLENDGTWRLPSDYVSIAVVAGTPKR